MKGNKNFPHYGFSDTATKILERLLPSRDDYHTVDVLKDPAVCEGNQDIFAMARRYRNFYVADEFVGGFPTSCWNLYESGELEKLLKE